MTKESYESIIAEIGKGKLTMENISAIRETMKQSKTNMSLEYYNGIIDALDKAEESLRPFMIVSGDNLAVAGDANDTEVKKYTYEIKFTKPVLDESGNITGKESEIKTYKNVFITPRQQTRITKLLVLVLPYFRKVNEETGEISDYTPFEVVEIFTAMDEEIYDSMYDLVAALLKVPEEDKEYMEIGSVMMAFLKFINDFPEAANEAEVFFA